MKICFLVLAHDQPALCARLVRHLLAGGDWVVVHLDRKTDDGWLDDFEANLGGRHERVLWAERVDVGWGKWSMVEATLNGLRAIETAALSPDYVCLLSGADYPIRPLDQLRSFLSRHAGTNFIESIDAEQDRWVSEGTQQERYRYRHYISWKNHPRLHNLSTSVQKKLGLRRSFPEGHRPHMGSQWWTLTWPVGQAILQAADDPRLVRFFRRTWVPDELFFQSLVRSVVADQAHVDLRHLTLYQFSGYGVPIVYYDGHEHYLAKQQFFFARKISPHALELRDFLDRLAEGSVEQPPVQDHAVGKPSDDYQRFLNDHGQGLKGRRSMLRVPDERLQDLYWNRARYFVLLSSSRRLLREARAAVDRMDGFVCHGELMHPDVIEFAGGVERFAGYGSDDCKIRDMSPQNFLVDLIQESTETVTGYLLHIEDGDDRSAELAQVHANDPNARLVVLQPEGRRPEPWLQAVGEAAAAFGAQTAVLECQPEGPTDDPQSFAVRLGAVLAVRDGRARRAQLKPTLLLHIGVHRTGTTAIQKLLAANRPALLQQGIHYAFDMENHTGMAGRIQAGELAPETFIAQLLEDSANVSCRMVIVSGEDFSRLSKVKALEGLSEHFEVRILCYLRRQDEWLESWYNQHVKWPWVKELSTATPRQFLARRREFGWIDYRRTLNRWSKVFGRENICVRVFEAGQLEGSLREDFCRQAGIKLDKLWQPGREINASVPPAALEFVRHLKLFTKDNASRMLLLNTVAEAYRRAGWDSSGHVFPDAARLEIIQQYTEGNAEVARQFLGRPDGALFQADLPGTDNAWPDYSLPSSDVLCRRIVRPLVRDLLRRIDNNAGGASRGSRDERLNVLERQINQLYAREVELRAMLGSRLRLARQLARLLAPWRRNATVVASTDPAHGNAPVTVLEDHANLPQWLREDEAQLGSMEPGRFIEEQVEPLLNQLVQDLKRARAVKGLDSEAIETLIGERQLEAYRLQRRVDEMAGQVSSARSLLRLLGGS